MEIKKMSFDSKKFKRQVKAELKIKRDAGDINLTDSQIDVMSEKLLKNRRKQKTYLNKLSEFLKDIPIRLTSRVKDSEGNISEKSILIDIFTNTYFTDNKDIEALTFINKRFREIETEFDKFSFTEIGLASINNYLFSKYQKQIDNDKYKVDLEYCSQIDLFVFVDYFLQFENKALDLLLYVYKKRISSLKEVVEIKEEV
jgi:hypothetical protein